MYTTSILMLLGWPLLIILCWFAVRIAVVFYEKKNNDKPSVE